MSVLQKRINQLVKTPNPKYMNNDLQKRINQLVKTKNPKYMSNDIRDTINNIVKNEQMKFLKEIGERYLKFRKTYNNRKSNKSSYNEDTYIDDLFKLLEKIELFRISPYYEKGDRRFHRLSGKIRKKIKELSQK